MDKNNEIYKEIAEIAPTLSNIEKNKQYIVEEEYFNNLNSVLEKKISNKISSPKKKTISILLSNKSYMIAAASLLVIFILSFIYYQLAFKTKYLVSNDLYWDEVIDNQTLVENIDENTLIDFFTNNLTKPNDFKINLSDENIDEEEVMKYIHESEMVNGEL